MPKPAPLTDDELKQVMRAQIRSASGFIGGELSEERRKALEYYLSEPFGNEQEGRSQVVSSDVQDVIESIMPDFMEIFAAGEEVVEFEPTGAEDVENAKQATDYINHVWNKQNDGYGVTHDWIKDGLIQKNGVIKIWWDEAEERKAETFTQLNTLALMQLAEEPGVEVTEKTEYQATTPEELQSAPDGLLYDVKIVRTKTRGRVHVVAVPPEEFLVSRRAVNLDDAPFTCHRVAKTVSELLEEGYSWEDLEDVPSYNENEFNEEHVARHDLDDDWPDDDDSPDPSMREILIYEGYLKVDFDGDGIAEMRQVVCAGTGYKILSNEEVDDHPFASLTPIRMPHKWVGRSLADLTFDIQLVKSTIQRQLLDNMYLANNARNVVDTNTINLDDLLVNRPGGIVRNKGPVTAAFAPFQTVPLVQHGFPLLEYWDGIREGRTGISRYSQGTDADSLNKTATGINQILGRAQRRILLMARTMAETGFRQAFRKILKLTIAHQDKAQTIRLRNKWVPIDPRHWNAEMDLTVKVGLGYGTKEQQVMMLERIIGMQAKVVELQGGVSGPVVMAQHVSQSLRAYTNAAGHKPATEFFAEVAEDYKPPQRANPEVEKMKAETQLAGQKMQMEDQRERQKMQLEHERGMMELNMKGADMQQRLEFEGEKVRTQGQVAKAKAAMPGGALVDLGAEQGFDQFGDTILAAVAQLQASQEQLAAALPELAQSLEALQQPKRVIYDERNQIAGVA